MEPMKELLNINFSYVFISVFVILIGIKTIVSLVEWFIEKLGLETKSMRKRKEEHNLLIQTSNGLEDLRKDHANDMKRSDTHDDEIRKDIIEIRQDIKNLTDMFTNNEIEEMRWKINNFANQISDGKRCNKDSYKHILRTYERYEKILQENGLENGEVEISMELINESYKQKLKGGF